MSKVNEKDAAAAKPESPVEEKTTPAVKKTSSGSSPSDAEEKTTPAVKKTSSGSSPSDAQPAPAMPFMPGSGFFANPCDFFLSMAGLLNVWLHDPSIKDIAKQIEKDPSFNKMAEQFRQTFHGGDDGVRQFDIKQQYFSTTEQQFMQNPQLMNMAKSLGTFIMQDLSMSQMLESLSNPAQKEQLEERMARIKEDPSLKSILEEIESGGPTAMMRYWNDEDVIKKVGEAMGLAVSEDATASAGHRVADGRKKLRRLHKEGKAIKAELMSEQEMLQLSEEMVNAVNAKLMSLQAELHRHGKMVEALKSDLMSLLEQHQHDEQIEGLKARLMKLEEQQQQLLHDHDVFTLWQLVATSEQGAAAGKQRIAALGQRTAALVQRIAAIEQITMANDRTEPTRARVGVRVAVTIGMFSHIYR